MRRILIIYTGGTIGMVASAEGYVPQAGALERQLAAMPRFHDPRAERLTLPASPWSPTASYRVEELATPLDSSNMGIAEWVHVARIIERHAHDTDAFVVLHGTDTMAYTASALSFMLEGLRCPVVLTGSQIPLTHLRNDAIDNLLGALILAAAYDVPEVCLYFRDRLFRGNRVQKVDAAGFDAFDSGNLEPLAKVGIGVEVDWALVRPPMDGPLRVVPITNPNVAAVRLYPGMTPDILAAFLRPPLQGLVLETYGSGNAPDRDRGLLAVLEAAWQAGIVVVNVTQCHKGRVNDDYAAGRALRDVGVIAGADMTPEAALTKLAWLLSQGLATDEVRLGIGRDLRGELTPPSTARRGWIHG